MKHIVDGQPRPVPMTKGEREDLQRLIRQREKAQKSAAKQRSVELLADFEGQLGAEYKFDCDETWAEANRQAEAEVAKCNERIAARSTALGIPRNFAPRLVMGWADRWENAAKERRAELRKMAVTKIAAIEAKAIVDIEVASVQAQTELAASGLTSEAARGFLERLPTVESLMQPLAFEAIAGKADPPVAEQLVSNAAERQRRYRKRLRDAVTSRVTSRDEGEP
jgi:hypothetical protein